MALAQRRKQGNERPAPDSADDVADEQDVDSIRVTSARRSYFQVDAIQAPLLVHRIRPRKMLQARPERRPRASAVDSPTTGEGRRPRTGADRLRPATSRPGPPVVVPRWVQLVLLPLALLGLWALARAAGRSC